MTGSNNRRTMMSARAAWVLAGALGLSAITGAQAQGWRGHGHMMFGLLQGVTLTSTQQQQVHADIKAGWAAARPTMQSLHAIEEQISSTMTSSGNVSATSVAPLLQQEETLRAQLDQDRLAVALQVRSVLTASQLAQAATAHAELATLHAQEQAVTHPGGEAE